MLLIHAKTLQVASGVKYYLRCNSTDHPTQPALELVGQSYVDSVSTAIFTLQSR